MNEIRAPLTQEARAQVRFGRLVMLQAQLDRVALQLRQELAVLAEEDTPFALRSFVPDELALALAESPGTCRRRMDEARLTVAHPRLMALVAASVEAALAPGEAVATHEFGMRHADAVLDELAGASDAVQTQVLDLVLTDPGAVTPHQLRKATRAARLLHDLQGASEKQDRIHDRRGVVLVDEYDGSATLQVGGTKTGAAAMLAAIDAHVTVPAPGETRSLAQRRYDFVMDLLCGRTQVTAPWQALIVVSLETLEGGDAPAEIPGLGLVTDDEARQVLAQADLRRAVVDANGQLIALDDQVLTGDQSPLGPAPPDQVAWQPEPDPVTDDVEEPVTVSDSDWLAGQEMADGAEAQFFAARAARREEQLLTLCATGIRQLQHHLHTQRHTPAQAGPCRHRPPDPPDPPDGGSGPPRPRPSRPGGDGRGHPRHDPHSPPPHGDTDPPADPPPEPEPSWADRDWLHIQEDVSGSHDQLDQQAHTACRSVLRPTLPATVWAPSLLAQQRAQDRHERQARASRWTSPALRQAVSTLRTTPPTPVPAASRSYPFRGRLARWIRARDITCTFPGCHLLAQRCELDHVLAYPTGKTEACNGACECTHHHQAKHAVMTVTRLQDGTMRWTTRFGTTRDRPPRPLLRGW